MTTEKDWTLTKPHWRDMHGRGFVEAICPHGVGHHKGVHGCDGCCPAPDDLWAKVTEEQFVSHRTCSHCGEILPEPHTCASCPECKGPCKGHLYG